MIRAEVTAPCPVLRAAAPARAVRQALADAGRPLDAATLATMKARFGHDFGRVRIHADARAAASAHALGALAYTSGDHLVFGEGRYAPHTAAGRRLLAHELTHVVQQTAPGTTGAPAAAAEREADRNAVAVAGPSPLGVQARVQPGTVQGADEPPPATLKELILDAARQARAHPDDATLMLLHGSSIAYRIVGGCYPAWSSRVKGVKYDASLDGVSVRPSDPRRGTGEIELTIGKKFILELDEKTLGAKVRELGRTLRIAGVPGGASTEPVCDMAGGAAQPAQPAPPGEKREDVACPCESLAEEPCSGTQITKFIDPAFSTAKSWLPSARRKLDAYQQSPARGSPVEHALRRHLGAASPELARWAITTIDTLARDLARPLCKHTCKAACNDPNDVMDSSFVKKACYEFCPDFFKDSVVPARQRAKAILHEGMHKWLDASDVAREWQTGYPPVPVSNATNNADSGACLIRDLGA